jgi:hypothetical protein
VTIPQLEAHFAEILALILLLLGGARLVVHELEALKKAIRQLRRTDERQRHDRATPNLSP